MTRAAPTQELLEQAERLELEAAARSWEPYPEYRESGVDWLEPIPAHWRLQKLKHTARIQFSNVDKKSEDGEQPVCLCNYVDVYYHDRITTDIEFMEATALPREVAKFQLMLGDVLVTKDSEDPHDICVPAVVAEDLPGVLCGYHLAQIRPIPGDACGPYLSYALASSGIRDQFRMRANGITRFGLSQDDICGSLVCLPPVSEQRAIAAFLDRKTRQIDELIEKKRRLIGLLQEKRTALISHAVTKGLNPDAPMKPSGIDWIGDVPAHWEVRRLRHLVSRIEQGWSPEAEQREASEDEWAVMRAGCANGGRFNEADHKALPPGVDPDSSLEIRPGDLLMSRACGSTELVGSVALVHACRPKLLLCDKLFRLRYRPNLVAAQFLAMSLGSRLVRLQLERDLSGAEGLARNIAQGAIKELIVVIPPLDEQLAVIDRLNDTCERLDGIAHAAEVAIARLTEYRQALISAAVTGKIDVHEEAEA